MNAPEKTGLFLIIVFANLIPHLHGNELYIAVADLALGYGLFVAGRVLVSRRVPPEEEEQRGDS